MDRPPPVERWAYHGTTPERLDSIAERGLVPGAAPRFGDCYSEHDGESIFFGEDPDEIRRAYGPVLLRFPWPADTTPDRNRFGRHLAGQYASRTRVPPASIEVEKEAGWRYLIEDAK